MQILIIATLFILVGVYSIIDVILSLLQQNINFNVNICCLFVGIGLMRGKESSRIWGRIWSAFFVVMFLVAIAMIAIHDPNIAIRVRGIGSIGDVSNRVIAITMITLLLLIPLWFFIALSASRYRNHPHLRRQS